MPLEDLCTKSLPDVSGRIRQRALSLSVVLGATLEWIARLDGAVRSFVTVLADRAAAARAERACAG